MTFHLHPTLSALHIHHHHLNLDDGGFSLTNMLLTRQSAYLASSSKCLSSIVDIINLLHPTTLDETSLDYHNRIDATAKLTDNSFFHLPHSSFSDYFNPSHNFKQSIPPWTLLLSWQLIVMIQNCNIPYICFFIHHIFHHFTYHFALDNPTIVANCCTLLGKDECLALKVGFYSVTNVLFQSIILRRLFLR